MEGIFNEGNYYRDLLIKARADKPVQDAQPEVTTASTKGLPLIDISLFQKGSEGLDGIFLQPPALFLPEDNANAVDLSVLLMTLREKIKDVAYRSGLQQLDAAGQVNQARSQSALNQVIQLSLSMASLNQNANAVSKLDSDITKGTADATADGLQKATSKETSLQAEVSLETDNYNQQKKQAENELDRCTKDYNNAKDQTKAAEQALKDAQAIPIAVPPPPAQEATPVPQESTEDGTAIQAQSAGASAVQTPSYQAGTQQTELSADELNKQRDEKIKQAENQLKQAQNQEKTAKEAMDNAQVAYDQVDRSKLTAAEQKLAQQQYLIESQKYEIDVTQVLPKTTDLLQGTAAFIEQIAAANPQLALAQTFCKDMNISLQPGQTIGQALTIELANRLETAGVPKAEAQGLAELIMAGDTATIAKLPKTTVDAIQQFANEVATAQLKANDALMQEVSKNTTAIGNLPPNTVETLKKVITSLDESKLSGQEEGELDPIDALLQLMSEAVDTIVELAEEQYKERLDLEQQLKNHI